MSLQTALGFSLTIVTVQVTPIAANHLGWPVVLAALALGPAVGIVATSAPRSSRIACALSRLIGVPELLLALFALFFCFVFGILLKSRKNLTDRFDRAVK